jgi:hypothetical protein
MCERIYANCPSVLAKGTWLKSIELAGRDGPDLAEATRLISSVSVETGSEIFQPPVITIRGSS